MQRLLRLVFIPFLLLVFGPTTNTIAQPASYASKTLKGTQKQATLLKALPKADALTEENALNYLPVGKPVPQWQALSDANTVDGLSRLLTQDVQTAAPACSDLIPQFYRCLLFPFHVFW